MGRPTTLSLSSLLSPRNNNTKPSYYWVELPESSYGIEYEVSKPVTSRLSPSTTPTSSSIGEHHDQDVPQDQSQDVDSPTNIFSFDMRMMTTTLLSPTHNQTTTKWMLATRRRQRKKKKRKKHTPFEVMMKRLNLVTSRYPQETAILYIREILEPSDPEFLDLLALDNTKRVVRALQLKESQVRRLRVMLLPQRREEILVSCLDHYRTMTLPFVISSERSLAPVVQHFAGFQRRYAKSNSLDERFDLLFGFSFGIHKYSAWMHQYERNRSREQVLSALARHWRHLLMKNTAEDLGLDREFSYPAVFCFLDKFKEQIETVDMQGLPPLKFVFETEDSPRPMNDECRVSLEDDSFSVSTGTTMTSASF